jgi:hypothetical protein
VRFDRMHAEPRPRLGSVCRRWSDKGRHHPDPGPERQVGSTQDRNGRRSFLPGVIDKLGKFSFRKLYSFRLSSIECQWRQRCRVQPIAVILRPVNVCPAPSLSCASAVVSRRSASGLSGVSAQVGSRARDRSSWAMPGKRRVSEDTEPLIPGVHRHSNLCDTGRAPRRGVLRGGGRRVRTGTAP